MAQSHKKKKIELDIHKVEINANGVIDYYWPLSYQERMEFADKLIRAYSDLVISQDESYVSNFAYKLLAKYFLSEAVGLFQGDLLRHRLNESEVEALVPENWRFWNKILRKERPLPPALIDNLVQAFPKSLSSWFDIKRVKRLLKNVSGNKNKNGMTLDGLRIMPVTQQVLKSYIISTQRTTLISEHAEMLDEDVVFCRASRWFDAVDQVEKKEAAFRNNPIYKKEMINVISDLYSSFGISLGDSSREHLEDMLDECAALFRVHYERLLKKPEALPRRLWTGTGGNSWDAMLRMAVMLNGGVAMGHDHGCGVGHTNNPRIALHELWGCTHFVAFNNNQVREIEKHAEKGYCLEVKIPEIIGVESEFESRKLEIFERLTEPDFEVKNIIFLADTYDGDTARHGPGYSDMFLVDFQARLMGKLGLWGYNAVMKIHPESPVLPPPVFEKELGVRTETKKFEEVVDEADMFFFLTIDTTTLRVAMQTNVPVVIVNFYDTFLTDKAADLLEKRCSLLPGRYDENNRALIDWDELAKAIKAAPAKANNREFYNYYYK